MSTAPGPNLGEDLRLLVKNASGEAEAWLWWTHVPTLPRERLGAIGGFRAGNVEAAKDLLQRALGVLRERGCTLAVGPMDGNTWRKYRFVTEGGTEPPFFLEPTHPPEWPVWWRAAGFTPLAEYFSTATDDLEKRDARLDAVVARMQSAGVTLRTFDPAQFEAELERIHAVSVVSFADNFLYTPLSRDEFMGQYRAIRAQVRPELILLAEQAGKTVGYVFATPDFAQSQRGEPLTTAIVKTLAVLPGRAYAGLGAWLLGEAHAGMRRLGFTRAIHALMHETNQSRNLSAHYATTIRRYTLFQQRLDAAGRDEIP